MDARTYLRYALLPYNTNANSVLRTILNLFLKFTQIYIYMISNGLLSIFMQPSQISQKLSYALLLASRRYHFGRLYLIQESFGKLMENMKFPSNKPKISSTTKNAIEMGLKRLISVAFLINSCSATRDQLL